MNWNSNSDNNTSNNVSNNHADDNDSSTGNSMIRATTRILAIETRKLTPVIAAQHEARQMIRYHHYNLYDYYHYH